MMPQAHTANQRIMAPGSEEYRVYFSFMGTSPEGVRKQTAYVTTASLGAARTIADELKSFDLAKGEEVGWEFVYQWTGKYGYLLSYNGIWNVTIESVEW